jgi:hypothetical protein
MISDATPSATGHFLFDWRRLKLSRSQPSTQDSKGTLSLDTTTISLCVEAANHNGSDLAYRASAARQRRGRIDFAIWIFRISKRSPKS